MGQERSWGGMQDFIKEKAEKKNGRQSSLGNPSKVHPAFLIIPSHYIRFNYVNVCKGQGGIFTRVVPWATLAGRESNLLYQQDQGDLCRSPEV